MFLDIAAITAVEHSSGNHILFLWRKSLKFYGLIYCTFRRVEIERLQTVRQFVTNVPLRPLTIDIEVTGDEEVLRIIIPCYPLRPKRTRKAWDIFRRNQRHNLRNIGQFSGDRVKDLIDNHIIFSLLLRLCFRHFWHFRKSRNGIGVFRNRGAASAASLRGRCISVSCFGGFAFFGDCIATLFRSVLTVRGRAAASRFRGAGVPTFRRRISIRHFAFLALVGTAVRLCFSWN